MGIRPGLDDPAPDVAGDQVVGLVLNDQIWPWQLLQPPGHGLYRAHGDLPALQPEAGADDIGFQSPGAHGAGELLDQLSPVGEHQHLPALAGCALDDGTDGLALTCTGGHDRTDPAVDLEGCAEVGQELLLVVAQDDRGHQDHRDQDRS